MIRITAAVVNKRLRQLVSGFTPVNDRIATIHINANFYNICSICVYAPTDPIRDRVFAAMYELVIPAKLTRLGRMKFSNSYSSVKVGIEYKTLMLPKFFYGAGACTPLSTDATALAGRSPV